ncbi:MAG: YjbQ family protein [Deltaproteobacteria bacterium]|nr:YjbQ family protein [Deltaproteobacteria bacterium]
MRTFKVETEAQVQAIDITGKVDSEVAAAGVGDGAILVYCPHTTAGIYVNEGHDPDVATDVMGALEKLVPRNGPYRHAEGNSAAHIRSILTGNGCLLPVLGGRTVIGTWQRIFFAEFDGPRTRTVQVHFLGGGR